MRDRLVATFVVIVAVVTLAPPTVGAQEASPQRTPDGQPDISGIFTFRTLTPLQRPTTLGDQETLTPEDAAAFEASERTRLNRDLFDPEAGAPTAGYQPRADGGVLSYNEFWYERGVELTSDKRTSLIIDPPDGRIPPRTPEAERRNEEERAARAEHRYDSHENRSLFDRCIMEFTPDRP